MAITDERAERVQADQEAMEQARAEVGADAVRGALDDAGFEASAMGDGEDVPIEEEPSGQQRIAGPGTEPKFSTDAGGYPPNSAEVALKAKKVPWESDLRRGSQLLLIVWAYVDEVRVAATKTFAADILRLAEYGHPSLKAGDVMQALDELDSRVEHDRACIDQAAALAEQILDEDPATTGAEMAEAIRTQLYERHRIDDDAHEATHGTEDHDEESDAEPADAEAPESEPAMVH